MRHVLRLKYTAMLICLVFFIVLGGVRAFAAETVDVRIPVSAEGADCTAVLYDEDGTELQSLKLADGKQESFSVTCEGVNNFQYTIRLADRDKDSVKFDRTVYYVTVEVFRGEGDRLFPVIYAEKLDASGQRSTLKSDPLIFSNKDTGGGHVIDDPPGTDDPPNPPGTDDPPDTPGTDDPSDTPTTDDPPGTPTTDNPPGTPTADDPSGPRVADDPPVRIEKRISGDKPGTIQAFVFEMTPLEPGNPLPEGASGGKAQVTINGEGEAEIGTIIFTAPGVYHYTVTERDDNAGGYTYDDTSYLVTYTITEESNGSLTCSREITKNEETAETCLFTNKYSESQKIADATGDTKKSIFTPKTGDSANPALYLWMLGIAAAVVVVLLAVLKKQKEKQT